MTEPSKQLRQRRFFRIALLVIFLALIRSIAEPFRLHYLHAGSLAFDEIMPFLLGALICSLSLLIMTLLSFFRRYLAGTGMALLCILAMLLVKFIYLP